MYLLSARVVVGRSGARVVVALALALLCIASPRPSAATTWRDDLGRDVTLAAPPQRIVTMLPSLTETVFALGAGSRVVGTDSYSNWPARAGALPKLGGLDDALIEAIVTLKPDLVLLSRSERTTSRLAALGVATFVIETQTYADIGRTVERVAALLGIPERAGAINDERERAVAAIVAASHARWTAPGPRVYFEVDRAPYAAGPASFIGDVLARLGARNAIEPSLGSFPKLNPEYVVRQDPDVIMTLAEDAASIAARPGWSSIRAVREHRICTFAPADRDLITRPGPRIAEGMRLLADCLARVAI